VVTDAGIWRWVIRIAVSSMIVLASVLAVGADEKASTRDNGPNEGYHEEHVGRVLRTSRAAVSRRPSDGTNDRFPFALIGSVGGGLELLWRVRTEASLQIVTKLKAFVAKNEIPWPQYYEWKGWESEITSSLGIDSIPTVFLVDQKGKLFSPDAGERLGSLIPELINRTAAEDDRAERS
jgi:hypothetical protein